MKRSAKLAITAVFGVFVLGISFGLIGNSGSAGVYAKAHSIPTPPAANTAPAVTSSTPPPSATTAGGKTIPKKFTLAKDSLSEYGEVAFDHESHASKPYSPDGKSVIGCVECHHTDQPKSALKAPLSTSERDVVLTMDVYQTAAKGVTECRACHFQDGNVPDGKSMPSATYTVGEKTTKKTLTNELAFHINCNTCHDAAFKLRPELKQKAGFATSKDCTVCHKAN
jgi:hypothetical protein